jgi:hypothetical protein
MDGCNGADPRCARLVGANGIGQLRIVGMKGGNEPICFDAVIERIGPEVPRFVVYPGKAWDETGTFTVDVSLNGISIGLRNLIPWKERGWHFGLSQSMCRKVGVETGDRVHVEMRRLGDSRPLELDELLKSDPDAQKAWNALPVSERRDFLVFVADAKQPETRRRRARRLLGR